MRRLLFSWGPVVGLMALIFAASASSDVDRLPAAISDKLLHLATYAALGLLTLRALVDGRLDRITTGRALAAIAITVLYGITDEFHQSFVPGRTPDSMDVVADAAGAILGATCLGALGVVRRRQPQRSAKTS